MKTTKDSVGLDLFHSAVYTVDINASLGSLTDLHANSCLILQLKINVMLPALTMETLCF